MAATTNATIVAKDIMTTDIVTVGPDTTVRRIAQLLSEKHISAVPVLDRGSLLGIVSEGDLIERQELGTAPGPAVHADDLRSHGMCAGDVMTRTVVTVCEDASLAEIAKTLLAEGIKRVIVMRGSKLVGLVSRSDIVRALAARPAGAAGPMSSDDDMIRYRVIETLVNMPGTSPWAMTVTVSDGVVELGGSIEDEAAREPSRVAIETIPYVVEARDHRALVQPYF
jgi:CBS domain-containing protein